MNPFTSASDISCSRVMRPGFFGLDVKNCVKEAVICGAEPVVQSAELQ